VDVGALLEPGAVEYIVSLITCGALVSLYRTRDGGALGATVVYDSEPEKEYFRSPEEFCEWLREVDHVVTARASGPSSVKRPRRGA
jgi:hypothetical protein